MTDFDIESAVTAGLQAANDHTALDAEWLRKFTRGVLAHHAGLPPQPDLFSGPTPAPVCARCGCPSHHVSDCDY